MTLEQLRIFVAVAERQHVTQGARDLNLSQSATSAAVAALETRYSTRLFDRIGRRIVLTEAGRLFLVEAKAVLARAAAAERVLADLAGLARGSLALAASQTAGNYWLPAVIERFRTRHPNIAISLAIGNTEYVASRVHEGAADLGFVEGEIDDPALAATPVASDQMVLIAPVVHPWAWQPPRTPEQIRAGPWVLRERGSGTRTLLEGALSAFGLALRDIEVAMEIPSNEAVRAAVEAGSGVTIISRLVAASAINAGRVAVIDVALPDRRFLMLRHREQHVTKAMDAFGALVVAPAAAEG